MPALIDSLCNPLVINDELLLAIYELELSKAPRQNQPPRSLLLTATVDVPRPGGQRPEGTSETRTTHRTVRRSGRVRVYSRSPPRSH